MKIRIIITSISLVCLMVTSAMVTANNTAPGEKVSISKDFKMDIYEDGKLTDAKISVHLQIYNGGGEDKDKIVVYWEDVHIRPLHDLKKIQLTPEHYSTYDGSIKNVMLTQNSFSFVIDLLSSGTGRTIQVVGQREGKSDVEATAIWFTEIDHKKIKIEWRSTDKIILPYKEVF